MSSDELVQNSGRDWFRAWFGDEYLSVYPHRDEREAEAAVRLYLRSAPPPAGSVLDLACGAGRHLRELLSAGFRGIGLDLSMTLLKRARELSPRARIVRGDMRQLPFGDGSFTGLTSFFTSFGYFASRAEDEQVVVEMRRVLATGGSFMLDFLNAARVRTDLVAAESNRIEGFDVSVRRSIVADTVVKEIHLQPDGGGAARSFVERVRLYEVGELEQLLSDAGLTPCALFGDYGGTPFGPDAERLILVGVAS
jgi:SAM-dependent methyltransferase